MIKFQEVRILIVDDNPTIHEDFRKILNPHRPDAKNLEQVKAMLFKEEKQRVELTTVAIDSAYQEKEAIAMVQHAVAANQPYALIFLDIRVPLQRECIKAVKKIWSLDPEIQIVLCSAAANFSWEEFIDLLGETDQLLFLHKPFGIMEVRQLTYALTKKWCLSQQLRQQVINLRDIVADRTNELNKTVSLLRSTLDSTADGILVVDNNGKIVTFNQQFAKMWNIPNEILKTGNDDQALEFACRQLKNPNSFLNKVKELYQSPDAEGFDELQFKDGRIFERISKPQKLDKQTVGRVWSFHEVTLHRTKELISQR